MSYRPELTAPPVERRHAAAALHLSLCAAIALVVAAAMARSNRDAGEPSSLTLETALPHAAGAEFLDVLAEGPVVSAAHWRPHLLDVLAEGPEVSAAQPPELAGY